MSRVILAFLALMIFAAVMAIAWTADAQAICGPRDGLVRRLDQQFNETQRAFGLGPNGRLMELFVSPEGSWTLLVTQPDETSCVVASGQNWTTASPKQPGLDS